MRSFGIAILGLPTLRTVELSKAAEEAGFDNVWIADESPSPPFRDATVSITAVLLNTKRIVLGSSIFVPYTRHPALLSVFMSTLNELAEGRLILGLGPGGSLTMRPLGLEMWDRPVTAMREAIIIAKRLFSGENVSFEGEIFKVMDTYLPAPPKTKVPIYLAARGPKLLELAGELADGCLLSVPGEYVGTAKESVEAGAKKAGRRIEDIQIVNISTLNPDPDKKRAIEAIRSRTAHMILDSPTIVHEKTGMDLARVEAAREAMRKEGRAKALSLITDDMVEKMVIIGSPRQCAEKIEEQFKAGLNQTVLNIPGNIVNEELIGSMGRVVIRVLRD